MTATQDAVIVSIRANTRKLFSNESVTVREVKVKRQQERGFYIVKSPRFLCKVKVMESGKVGEHDIFVKSRSDVLLEFEKMEKLWHSHYLYQDRYLIPEPLFLDRENSLLFMENFPGETFVPLFYKKVICRKRLNIFLEQTATSAAHWLADFQSIYRSEERKPPPELMSDYDRNLEVFATLGEHEKKRIIAKAQTVMKECPLYPDTYVHDQYLFRNILFRGDKICVVDFPNLRIGWPLYDFFRFVLGIDRLVQYPFISNSICKTLREGFITEYIARSSTKHKMEMLEGLWGPFVIAYIGTLYPRHKGVRGLLNERFVHQTLRKLVCWSKT